MLFPLTPSTVSNPGSLRTTTVPKRFLSIGLTLFPRGLGAKLFWRVFFEKSLPRYAVVLLPFPIVIFAKPEWALGLSQAPLLMFGLVLWIETYVLSVSSPEKRKALIDEAERARGLDLLRARGTEVLTKIAVKREIQTGEVHLVVEQSGLLRVPPLTMVSIQVDGGGYLDLDADEQALMAGLFAPGLDEATLQRINLSLNTQLQVISLDTRTISAHARLEAMAAQK